MERTPVRLTYIFASAPAKATERRVYVEPDGSVLIETRVDGARHSDYAVLTAAEVVAVMATLGLRK